MSKWFAKNLLTKSATSSFTSFHNKT